MNILVKNQKEQRNQREDVRTLQTSVEKLYNDTEDNNADYFDVDETRVTETKIYTNNIIGSSQGNQNESEEPRTKEAKRDNVFAVAETNFRVNKTVDDKDRNELATMVNSREEISDDKFQDLLKNVNRPENCTALTKTRVNQLIGDMLSPSTISYDSNIRILLCCRDSRYLR